MLLSLGILLLFGSNWVQLSGAGALAVLTTAFVAAHGWKESGKVFASRHFTKTVISLGSIRPVDACIS